MLHKEILTEEQARLLPLLKVFKDQFGLVGGTAVAFQIGHRESIDFDLFPKDPSAPFKVATLKSRFSRLAIMGRVINESESELTFFVSNVKFTFFNFQHSIPFTEPVDKYLDMPNLLTLAAMKAYALGYRSKWKDYVDLYFIMRDFHPISEVIVHAQKLFSAEFNERLFREQIGYFEDINYKEVVIFKDGFEVPDDEVKRFLQEVSVS
jgi:hypothetical protein